MSKTRKRIRPPTCPYCGERSVLRDISFIFPDNDSGKKVFVCKNYPVCDAYVNTSNDGRPLGQLADGHLRSLRIKAHRKFDLLWNDDGLRLMTRSGAYHWMMAKFSMTKTQAHIGQFGPYMCEKLIIACSTVLKNWRFEECQGSALIVVRKTPMTLNIAKNAANR